MNEDKDADEVAFLSEITTVKVENMYQEYRDPQQQQGKKDVQGEETNTFFKQTLYSLKKLKNK